MLYGSNGTIVIQGAFTTLTVSEVRKEEPASRRRTLDRDLYPPEIADRLMLAWATPAKEYDRSDVHVLQEALEHIERQYAILLRQQDNEALTEQQEATSKALSALLEKLLPYGDSLDAILALYQELETVQESRNQLWDERDAMFEAMRERVKSESLMVRERHKMYVLLMESYEHLKAADKAGADERRARRHFMIDKLAPLVIEKDEIPF